MKDMVTDHGHAPRRRCRLAPPCRRAWRWLASGYFAHHSGKSIAVLVCGPGGSQALDVDLVGFDVDQRREAFERAAVGKVGFDAALLQLARKHVGLARAAGETRSGFIARIALETPRATR